MCENLVALVEIGGMLVFRVGRSLQCHFQTWPSYSSQKSCVKIWFGLVEPFKSYHGNKHKKEQVKLLSIDEPKGGLQ